MEGVLAGGFCFPSSQGLRRILDQKCGGEGGLRSGRVQDGFWGKEICISCGVLPGASWVEMGFAVILRLFLAGVAVGTILWPSMWNTGLPGGPLRSLRDSGRPFATETSCPFWRRLLMGRTSDSRCRGLRGR